jgi:drug/metabolite transporter superfamily protein YnfA
LGAIALGFVVLGSYGILVTMLDLDFSKALGAYVGFFAVVAVLFGWLVFGERVPGTTWVGLAVILAGSVVIQFGSRVEAARQTRELPPVTQSRSE